MKFLKNLFRSKIVILVVVVVVLVGGGYLALNRFRASAAQAAGGSLDTVILERGSLTSMIGAAGTVRSAQAATLAWQTSGRVGEIKTSLGQEVSAGQALASLDPTSLSQNILQAQVDLINAQNALDDLYEADPLEIAQANANLDDARQALEDLQHPSDLAITQAEMDILDAQEALDDAQQDVDRLARGRANQEQISLARADYLLAQDRVDQMQARYEDTPGDPDEDPGKALALSNLAAAENARDRALGALNWYLGKPSEAEIADKEAALALAQARFAEAQQALEDLKNPPAVQVTLAQARITDAQDALDRLESGPTEDEVTIAQTRLTQAQAALKQAGLEAPFAGVITEIQAMPGDMVSPGTPALRLDNLSSLYVDLEVSEVDIHQVHVGQQVDITFDAILDRQYTGEVDRIGQVGVANQGVISFVVTVRLLDADESVRPGMTAVANIRVAEVADVLQLPNRAIQEEDGKRFVYVLRGNGGEDDVIEQAFVQIGVSSDASSEIISTELKEGDRIMVDPPAFFMPGMRVGGRLTGGRP
ncbi:MAG: efflux RND transporter periplasmic adaptor subunit [Chloroflexota bacterium]|nr:MAG: efflux RND transporter periplasmic adaptor subunit [Chloroflexota bacterium]